MQNTLYGYIRVSSRDQNEEMQVLAMREFGVNDEFMIIDKLSGKDFEHSGYRRLVKRILPITFYVSADLNCFGGV